MKNYVLHDLITGEFSSTYTAKDLSHASNQAFKSITMQRGHLEDYTLYELPEMGELVDLSTIVLTGEEILSHTSDQFREHVQRREKEIAKQIEMFKNNKQDVTND